MTFRAGKKYAKDISLYDPIGVDKDGETVSRMDVLEAEGKEVLEIGEGAFAGDDKIQKVQFNGVLNHITIRKNAFEGCVNLIMVLTDSGIFNIESNAFKNCPKLIRLGN